ncbi:MAG: helix-turn-helix domain-containing protein [Thermodesulfobacteriota bacterium]
MEITDNLLQLGLSQYETTAYLSLVGGFPLNGSQLSRRSGIPRARIYDVLRALRDKGLVVELEDGRFAPLPPEELLKRLRHSFESNISRLEEKLKAAAGNETYDFVWVMRGYRPVMNKAKEMAASAENEIYVRLFPPEGQVLIPELKEAEARGVQVKYISMGPPPVLFGLQVVHPEADRIETVLGGRTLDLVVDRQEVLVGMFETGREDRSPINWAKNHWFVVATRDSLRHDFFHYFLHKILENNQPLNNQEKNLYHLIAQDI